MHMTLEADYAVRIVEFLAVNPGRADAKTISERTSVTLRFTLKILRTLVSDGIVRSYKGAKGGYELAKPPKEITLRSVIEAVEGPYMISRCQGDAYSCQRTSAVCITSTVRSRSLCAISWSPTRSRPSVPARIPRRTKKARGKRQKRKRIRVKVHASTYLKRKNSF